MTLEMKYFVLKPRPKDGKDFYALASRAAMRAYAEAIYPVDKELTKQLIEWVEREEENALDFSRKEGR